MHVVKLASLKGEASFQITAEGHELSIMGEVALKKAIELAAEVLAKELIESRGREMVASIPVDTITKMAVAKTVVAISELAGKS